MAFPGGIDGYVYGRSFDSWISEFTSGSGFTSRPGRTLRPSGGNPVHVLPELQVTGRRARTVPIFTHLGYRTDYGSHPVDAIPGGLARQPQGYPSFPSTPQPVERYDFDKAPTSNIPHGITKKAPQREPSTSVASGFAAIFQRGRKFSWP